MPDQYVFCHLAFLEYVLNMEYIDEIDLSGFDDDCDSEWKDSIWKFYIRKDPFLQGILFQKKVSFRIGFSFSFHLFFN